MKVVKLVFSVLLAILCFQLSAQTAYSENSYIKNNIKKISGMLVRAGATEALTEAQVLKLEKIFAQKESKWNQLVKSGKDKGEMSKDMMALDKEFNPAIEDVLSKNQKAAFRKASSPVIEK